MAAGSAERIDWTNTNVIARNKENTQSAAIQTRQKIRKNTIWIL